MPDTQKKRKAEAINIYRKCCKACGICTAFCPVKALGTDEYGFPIVVNLDACTACNLCTDRCPDLAIEVIKAAKTAGQKEGTDEGK